VLRVARAAWQTSVMAIDWTRIRFTEHMTEAAVVIGECHVVLDFGSDARVTYQVKIYESLKGAAGDRYFALGIERDDPHGFQPIGSAPSPEDALERCLADAGVFHRRRVKQAGE